MVQKVIYRDVDLRFRPHPVTGDIPLLENDRAVGQSVANAVQYNHFERPFRPLYGGNVRAQLFNNVDPIILTVIRDDIQRTVMTLENDHIEKADVLVEAKEERGRNSLYASVRFKSLSLDKPVDIRIFLQEVR